MNVPDVITGIADKVRTIARFVDRTHEKVPDNPSPPCAIVRTAPGTFLQYKRTMQGTVEGLFLVTVVESAAWSPQAQANINVLLGTGTGSIFDAVTGVVTGVDDFAYVTEAQNYGEVVVAGIQYFGIDFMVEVSTL